MITLDPELVQFQNNNLLFFHHILNFVVHFVAFFSPTTALSSDRRGGTHASDNPPFPVPGFGSRILITKNQLNTTNQPLTEESSYIVKANKSAPPSPLQEDKFLKKFASGCKLVLILSLDYLTKNINLSKTFTQTIHVHKP